MDSFKKKVRAEQIKKLAKKAGFDDCGISESGFLEGEAPKLEQWLKTNQHGEMAWMENWYDKRLDTRKLVEDSKSVITVLLNYYPEKEQNSESYKISKYAYGKDYHFVVKEKLKSFYNSISKEIGQIDGRLFVDSAPVMDRAWAKKSGLGWIGKHTLLITKSSGSFFFIGHIISDLELEADNEIPDFCGDCTRCIDACPTDAISNPYWLDAKKCISYLTIELKNEIPETFKDKMDDWIFGCDICQDVCPWNRFSKQHNTDEFKPLYVLLEMSKSDWENMDDKQFSELFPKSAVKRTKYSGLKRNIDFLK